MQNARRTLFTIELSTALVVLATVLASLAGSVLLSRYSHSDFHEGIVRSVATEAARLEEVTGERVLAATEAFDAMDQHAIVAALRRGEGHRAAAQQLLRVFPVALKANVAFMGVLSARGQVLAVLGDAWRPLTDAIPLTDNDHTWLYWAQGWWLEQRIDIRDGAELVATWVARMRVPGMDGPAERDLVGIDGAVLAVCALKDKDYPCLSLPAAGEAPTFYLSENGMCLASGCEGGLRDEAFNETLGVVAAYRALEGYDVMLVYSVALKAFFAQEQVYERLAIGAVLAVALSGLWMVFVQARPIARNLVRTTIHLQEIMNKLPESVVTVSESGAIRTANARTKWMLGYDEGELKGRGIDELLPGFAPGDRGAEDPAMSPHHEGAGEGAGDGYGGELAREMEARHRDGTPIPVELVVGAYRFEDERYLIGIIRDIRQRKRAEESLRRWEYIFQNAGWGIAIATVEEARLETMNPAFARLYGFAEGELAGRRLTELLAPPERDAANFHLRTADTVGHHAWEALHLRADGGTFIALLDITSIKDSRGQVAFRVFNLRDVTEARHHQQELEHQRARLRELAANRETVREQERTHMAREIHDELGQSLTSLRMKAALLALGLGESDPQAAARADEMKALIDQTIQVVRNVASNLRPGALDLGIVSAIEWLAQDFEERTGILCGLDIDQEIELEDERATMVFRILQESLTNVARHARASHVEISLLRSGEGYLFEVSDDGQGFDVRRAEERKTFGLLGIRERATVLGGEIEIVAAPGGGTRLRLSIPAQQPHGGGA